MCMYVSMDRAKNVAKLRKSAKFSLFRNFVVVNEISSNFVLKRFEFFRNFARTKHESHRNSFALLLHSTVFIFLFYRGSKQWGTWVIALFLCNFCFTNIFLKLLLKARLKLLYKRGSYRIVSKTKKRGN